MLRKHSTESKFKRGPTKYVGITTDAKKLGVTYMHLWFVLEGHRQSPDLLARYRQLQKQKPKQQSQSE